MRRRYFGLRWQKTVYKQQCNIQPYWQPLWNSDQRSEIKSRPHWLPREFSSIISVSCYTPFTGNSRSKQNATATAKTIATHVEDWEKNHPNSCVMVMGDFKQLSFQLHGYYQETRILDKCYLRVKDVFEQYQLSRLRDTDHYATHLIPTYTPLSKYKPTRVTRRILWWKLWKSKSCLWFTIWDNLLSEDDSIQKRTEIIKDSISISLPTFAYKKKLQNVYQPKPRTRKHIPKMLEQKQAAHDDGSRKLYNKLKCDISKSITIAKKDYSAKSQ